MIISQVFTKLFTPFSIQELAQAVSRSQDTRRKPEDRIWWMIQAQISWRHLCTAWSLKTWPQRYAEIQALRAVQEKIGF